MESSHKHIDATYYISRVLIPPLERIFNLVGADVRRWYDDMPKSIRIEPDPFSPTEVDQTIVVPDRLNIDEHFHSSHCLACGALTSEGLLLLSPSHQDLLTSPQGYATIAI
jgi:DNA polymerase zeta